MSKKGSKERSPAPVETGHDHRASKEHDKSHPKAPDGISGYF